MSVSLKPEVVGSQYKNQIFLETGTFEGGGVWTALEMGFSTIISIEIDRDYFQKSRRYIETFGSHEVGEKIFDDDPLFFQFQSGQQVYLYLGDSMEVLPRILKNISTPITFWLDAHAGNTPTHGKILVPLLEELDIISKHPVKNHSFLIDDRRLMGVNYWGEVTQDKVISKLLEINENYVIEYIDSPHAAQDIIGAFVL